MIWRLMRNCSGSTYGQICEDCFDNEDARKAFIDKAREYNEVRKKAAKDYADRGNHRHANQMLQSLVAVALFEEMDEQLMPGEDRYCGQCGHEEYDLDEPEEDDPDWAEDDPFDEPAQAGAWINLAQQILNVPPPPLQFWAGIQVEGE